ncbi:hypothetical protein BJ165DRAFT_1533920 [Panaeolus papilionaceus]|nr:hypothetical protein BJ165DRAFT_1533920 [Panaeolus papilionaceus]
MSEDHSQNSLPLSEELPNVSNQEVEVLVVENNNHVVNNNLSAFEGAALVSTSAVTNRNVPVAAEDATTMTMRSTRGGIPIHGVETSRSPSFVPLQAPMVFNGESGNVNSFLAVCYTYFSANPEHFPTDMAKIYFALSYMTQGITNNWRICQVFNIKNGRECYSSWTVFEDHFRRSFGAPALQGSAIGAMEIISSVQQGGRPIYQFFIELEMAAFQTGFDEDNLLVFCDQAVDAHIRHCITARGRPSTYRGYKELALEIDQAFRA